ncbi:MAG: hypothetical protein HC881_22505 [Leptolyngbyaceae cyanobacterium SL_7_1]|nr:hypothetical protein [Leptolyngbyaceae cyanobacterium SL_7_1]
MNLQNQTQATLLAEIQRLNTEITTLQSDQDDRLQLALEVAHIGMWDWNMVTGRITWSRGHEELFGLVPGSFDGNYQRLSGVCIQTIAMG